MNFIEDTITLYQTCVKRLNNNKQGKINFIVVGAMDGKTHDPLYPIIVQHDTWNGLFIEPLQDMFELLKETYSFGGDRFHFIRCAVTDHEGPIAMTRVPLEKVGVTTPAWADGISTLLPQKHIMSKNYDLFSQTIEETVNGFRLNKIKDLYPYFSNTNIFQCDTEGYDIHIFMQLSEMIPNIVKPDVLYFESVYMSNEEKKNVNNILENKNYYVYFDQQNMLAFL